MTGIYRKKLYGIFSFALALWVVIAGIFSAILPILVKAATILSYEQTSVTDDLKNATINGKPFDWTEYSFDENKETQVLTLAEYCYSFYENMQDGYGLYIYVYNPQGLSFDVNSSLNTVQLAYGVSSSTGYIKYSLRFLNYSTETNYERLFYKFKILFSQNEKTEMLSALNSNARIYRVSGIISHKSFNKNIWFAGGAWSWDGFAPFNWYTLKTMKPAMQSVIKNNIQDVLITMWGDGGKECSFYSLLSSLYAIRQYAEGNFDEEKISKEFYELFKIPYESFLLLDLPNRAEAPLLNRAGQETIQNPCKSLLYVDPFMGILDNAVRKVQPPIPYAHYAALLKAEKKKTGEFEYLFETLSKLCSVLEIKVDLGVRTRNAYQAQDKKALADLVKDYITCEQRIREFHKVISFSVIHLLFRKLRSTSPSGSINAFTFTVIFRL